MDEYIAEPLWLKWAREIQAIAQTGDHYALNGFQKARYSRLNEIAAEIISEHSDANSEYLIQMFKSQTGYATPKVDVRGAVFQKKKILLVRERADSRWTMPGGWADVGESPSQSVVREVFEESGLIVKASKLVGIFDANRSNDAPLAVFHAYKIIFLCEILDGELSLSDEISEVRFFSSKEIPTGLSRLRTNERHIEKAYAALREIGYSPVFD